MIQLGKIRIFLLVILIFIISNISFGEENTPTSTQKFIFPVSKDININPGNGTFIYRKSIFSIPGKNDLNLDISLIYSSQFYLNSLRWRFSIEKIENNMFFDSDGNVYSLYLSDKTITEKRDLTILTYKKEVSDLIIIHNQTIEKGKKITSSYEIKYKNGTVKYFDRNGLLLKVTNRFGNVITYNWDVSSGTLKSIVDTYGNVINFNRTGNNYEITYDKFKVNVFGDEKNYITSIIDLQNKEIKFIYKLISNTSDNRKVLNEIIDDNGYSTKIDYLNKSIDNKVNHDIHIVGSIYEKDNYSNNQYCKLVDVTYSGDYLKAYLHKMDYSTKIEYMQRALYREYKYNYEGNLTSETLVKKAFATTNTDRVVMRKTYNGYFNSTTGYPLNIVSEYSTDYDYLARTFTLENIVTGGVAKKIISIEDNFSKSSNSTPETNTSYGTSTRKVEETYTYDTYGNVTSEKMKDFLTGNSVTKAYQYFYHPSIYFYNMLTSEMTSDDTATFTDVNDTGKKWYGKSLISTNANTVVKKVDNYMDDNLLSTKATIEYGDGNYKKLTFYTYNSDGRVASQTIKENNQPSLNLAAILVDSSEKVTKNFYYYDNNTGDNSSKKHTIVTELIDKNQKNILERKDFDVITGNLQATVLSVDTNKSALSSIKKDFSNSSENKYDYLGRIIESRKLGETNSTKYVYKDNDIVNLDSKIFKGNSITTTLPNGYISIEIFNGHEKLIAKGEKLKSTDTSYKLLLENTYTDDGELIKSSYDTLGNRTDYIYDYLYRNVGIKNPDNSSKFTIIDDGKNRVINVDENGIAKMTDYDEFGKVIVEHTLISRVLNQEALIRLKKFQKYSNECIFNQYNSLGNIISSSKMSVENEGTKSERGTNTPIKYYSYDNLGRLSKIRLSSDIKGLASEFPKFFPKYRYSSLISKGRAIIFDF